MPTIFFFTTKTTQPRPQVFSVKFIFGSARLGLFSSVTTLQIADVALRIVFLLFLPFF